MVTLRSRNAAPALALAASVAASLAPVVGTAALAAQGAVLSSQITFPSSGGSLAIDLQGGGRVDISVVGGALLMDGVEVARFDAGGPLEASWRSLLARALDVPTDGLPTLLLDWSPPPGMSTSATEAATTIQGRLRAMLQSATAVPSSVLSLGAQAGGPSALAVLLRSGRTGQIAAAADELPTGEVRVTAGETVVIGPGETLDASLVALDGNVTVGGTVTGDLVVLGGSLTLGSDARVLGTVRSADATINGSRAGVSGGFVELPQVAALADAGAAARIDPDEIDLRIREGIEAATRNASRPVGGRQSSLARRIGDSINVLFVVFATFIGLFLVGLGTLYFFPRRFEVIARTAGETTWRSALVGTTGLVLSLPAWVIGMLFLVASIIGIPALILWIPGVPVLLAIAVVLGYLAVARGVGQWFSKRDLPILGSLGVARPAVHLGIGLAVILATFALAGLLEIAPNAFEPLQILLILLGSTAATLAAAVGLGAVILSKAGKDAAYAGAGWDPVLDEAFAGGDDEPPA